MRKRTSVESSEQQDDPPQASPPSLKEKVVAIVVMTVVFMFAAIGVLNVFFRSSVTDGVTAEQAESTAFFPSHEDMFVDLVTGEEFNLSDFTGKPTIVNLFGSWCAPCVREMPEFQAAFDAYGGEVNFIGLAVEDDAESALDLVERTGVQYPTALDTNRSLVGQFEPGIFPFTALLDERGALVDSQGGELDAGSLFLTIEARLGIPSPELEGDADE